MEIGDFIWQFYISPPSAPFSYAYLDFNNTISLQTQEQIYSWFSYWCGVLFGVSMISALFAPINFTSKFLHFSHHTSISIWKEQEFRRDFLLSTLLRWFWQETNVKTHQYQTIQCNSDCGRGGIQSHETRTRTRFNISTFCGRSFALGASLVFVCLSFCCTFSLKWTDDQCEKQEVISSENICGHKFLEKYLGNYLQKTSFWEHLQKNSWQCWQTIHYCV